MPMPGTSRRNFLRRAIGAIVAAPALPAIAGAARAAPAMVAVPVDFTGFKGEVVSAWIFYPPSLIGDEAIERTANLMWRYCTVDYADEARAWARADHPWRDPDAD